MSTEFIPGENVYPTPEDNAIFMDLKDRGLWPIDNDYCDYAALRAHWRQGRSAAKGARNFDAFQQTREASKSP